jgi:release factor glutamine methyltransferase
VTGRARTWLLAFGETALTRQQAQLETLLSRRQRGEPVAHLVGEREFWSLPLLVSPATLIPRPDTECLVEQALARLPARRAAFSISAPAPARSPWRWPANARTARSPRWT